MPHLLIGCPHNTEWPDFGRTTKNRVPYEKALPRNHDILALYRVPTATPLAEVMLRATRATSNTQDTEGRNKPNVAGLGESLYTDHLITVGFSGVLLFAALIGAVAITNPKRPTPAGTRDNTLRTRFLYFDIAFPIDHQPNHREF